jgi:hypothetical protein
MTTTRTSTRRGCRRNRRFHTMVVVLVTATALLGAACGASSEEEAIESGLTPTAVTGDAAPATSAPTTSSGSTQPSTVAAPATTADDSGTADRVTTTTTEPAHFPASGGEPVAGPVFVAVDGSVLGWWDGETWVEADRDGAIAPAVDGVHFRAASPDTEPMIAGPAGARCFPESGLATWHIGGSGVLVSGDHPLRHDAMTEAGAVAAHIDAVRAVLDADGIAADVPVEIDRVLRFDLQGDGIDEVIIKANRLGDGGIAGLGPGHYSIVIVRKLLSDDSVANIVLHADTDPPGPGVADSLTAVEVRGVADVDGDGTLELATSYYGYEWGGAELYSLTGAEPTLWIGSGCGV